MNCSNYPAEVRLPVASANRGSRVPYPSERGLKLETCHILCGYGNSRQSGESELDESPPLRGLVGKYWNSLERPNPCGSCFCRPCLVRHGVTKSSGTNEVTVDTRSWSTKSVRALLHGTRQFKRLRSGHQKGSPHDAREMPSTTYSSAACKR